MEDEPTPPEATLLYPTGITLMGQGLGLRGGLTAAGYDEAVPCIFPAAQALKSRGVQGIAIMGTSLTFYKGASFNEEIKRRVSAETGLPATTMSSAIVDGLKIAGAKQVSIGAAYSEDITSR